VITNQAAWSNGYALAIMTGEQRQFAEQSLADLPSVTAVEMAEADAALKPLLPNVDFFDLRKQPWLPLLSMGGVLIFCVCLPSIVAALAFRGGLLLRIAGITFVRRDGAPASRLRLCWRNLISWSPLGMALLCFVLCKTSLGSPTASILAALPVAILVPFSMMLPNRGLQDMLAGTWPVPR
jgi:hypothetical protein